MIGDVNGSTFSIKHVYFTCFLFPAVIYMQDFINRMLECNVFDIMLQPVSSFLDCVINFWSFFEKVDGFKPCFTRLTAVLGVHCLKKKNSLCIIYLLVFFK